jgi:hypothetical protein
MHTRAVAGVSLAPMQAAQRLKEPQTSGGCRPQRPPTPGDKYPAVTFQRMEPTDAAARSGWALTNEGCDSIRPDLKGRRRRLRLARPLERERVWTPDREAMLAALRVVLDLPRQLPESGQGGGR